MTSFQAGGFFFTAAISAYGFFLNPASLSGNYLVNNVLMASFDAIGYILSAIFVNRTGRTKMLFYSYGFTVIFFGFKSGKINSNFSFQIKKIIKFIFIQKKYKVY